MADRRADDTPLAPRRSLSGPSDPDGDGGAGKRPLSERVSAAVSAAGTAVQSAAKPGSSSGSKRAASQSGPGASGNSSQGAATSRSSRSGARGSRRARLRLVHVDPWSIMKTAFLLAIAFGIVTVVAVAVVWSVLDAAGVWDSINKTVSDVLGGDSTKDFDVQDYVGTSRVLGFTMIVAVFDVLLITAISTLGAFLYNLAATLLGGVEVTLAEDER